MSSAAIPTQIDPPAEASATPLVAELNPLVNFRQANFGAYRFIHLPIRGAHE